MFVRQIINPAKDRHVRIDFVFGSNVHKRIIFDVEIGSAEIQFLPRVDEFGFDRGAESFPPKIGTGNIDFVAWTPWQTRTYWLRNIGGRSFVRVEISVARSEN